MEETKKNFPCHQCRRAKSNVIYCTYKNARGRSCRLKYCGPCLKNTYDLKEEQMEKMDNWVCPKSRRECDCSACRRSIGLLPIGNLTSDEKMKYIEMVDCANEQLTVLQAQEGLLPKATIPVTKVVGIEMNVENVGPALQFLEYCKAFSQVLNIEDGEAQRILEEIAQGRQDGSSMESSMLENFQKNLLNIILKRRKKTRGSNSSSQWVADIEKLIDSKSFFTAVPREYFQSGSCYHELDANWKLRILNFLCELALAKNRRLFIPKSARRKTPIEIDMKWKELPATQKVIALWKRLKEEDAKAATPPEDGMILTFEEEEEYERQLSELEEEFRNAYLQMLAALEDHNLGQGKDARKMKPLMSDTNGNIYFQIDGYFGSAFSVQDIAASRDHHPICKYNIDKWYVFTQEDESVVREHFSSRRIWEAIFRSALQFVPTKIWRKYVGYPDEEEDDEVSTKDDEETEYSDSSDEMES